MTVDEMITQAETRSEEVYDEPTWIGFINAALDDLTPVVKLLDQVTVANLTPSSGAVTIALSSLSASPIHEFLTVYYQSTTPALSPKQLWRISLNDHISEGWKLTSTSLVIPKIPVSSPVSTAGSVIIDFYKKLEHVTDGDDIPELPVEYHQLLVMYMCSLSQQKEEELEDKRDFFSEYLLGKQTMALNRIWEMEPHNRKLIREHRINAALGIALDNRR